ncbi:MAG TPA: acyl-CoA dehydrogenase family protein, partial [Mycobacterium sp.]|nr:acyl-CoA dehydrogenase family protein [Mycobacterium sp.]
MTQAPELHTVLPGTDAFAALLADVAAGTKDRDLNDENPFDQVSALKRAGFGTLRLPTEFGGPGLTVRQLFAAVIDVAQADPIVAHIFRTHFWFVEERLRALHVNPADAVSRRCLDEVAAGRLFANAFSEKGALA